MHEIEPSGYCSIEEYYRFLEHRKKAGDIALGGLYLVLADIRRGRDEKEAFKFPIRVQAVDESSAQHAIILADLLDIDLQPAYQTRFVMNDGIVRNPNICILETQQPVKEMYIKEYEDFLKLKPGQARIADEIESKDWVLV